MLGDKEFLNDALMSQKFITDSYNSFANECASKVVRNEFINILNQEHDIQASIFDEMSKRGWYPVTTAQQTKVDEAKQKFQNQNPQY